MSDVHYPVCLVMPGKRCATIENNIDLVTHNEYLKTKHVKMAWKQELCNQYTQSFNVKEIEQFQSKLTHIISEMTHVTQQIIDTLYTDMKTMLFITLKSQVYMNKYTPNSRYHTKRTRRHVKKTWLHDECEILRKECLLIKNSLRYDNTSNTQYQSFHEHVQ